MSDLADLYDFPADYVGRKTYVSVRGHSRSIPKYKTYLGTDRRNHLLPEYGGDGSGYGQVSTYVMPDKPGYVSPLDFKMVEGRAAHRDHMRRHNVIEVGDQPVGYSRNSTVEMPPVREDIRRAYQEVNSR